MTHTLHRLGSRKSLERDYVILAMTAKGLNREGAAPKLRKILSIFARYHPVNMGNVMGGCSLCKSKDTPPIETIKKASDESVVHAVYTDKETVKKVLKELKEADLGMSIVVSGIFDEVFGLCKDVSIRGPFTVNLSLGIMGKTERLPHEEILEIITMCGHAMVSKHLTRDQIEKVKKGKITVEQAAKELAKQCVCGIFNPTRAAELLNRYLRREDKSEGGYNL